MSQFGNNGNNLGIARSIFGNIRNVKTRVEANYVRPGIYWAYISAVRVGETRKSEKYIAIEMTTLRVVDGRMSDQAPGAKPHVIGEEITHMLMAKHESSLGNFRQFLVKVVGIPDADITEEQAMEVTNEKQPLRGTVVRVEARTTTTRKNQPFTAITYAGEIPAAEVLQYFTEDKTPALADLRNRLFPGDYLERLIAAEQQAAGAA